jgi:PKD repeat protein
MRTRFSFLALIWLSLAALSVSGAAPSITDPEVARQLGVTVQQLHGLRDQYALTNDQLLNLPANQLQILVADLLPPNYQQHQREHEFRALKMMDEHGHIPPDGLQRALEHSHRHIRTESDLTPGQPDPSTNEPTFGDPGPMIAGIQTNAWTWLGPGNIGGRVRAILPHPTDANTLWCGGVDGGVWKTINGGTSWFPLNDFMGNLAVASLTMDPTNANVLYAGTGEGTYNIDAVRGAGIFKSVDGGTNWFQLSSTANSSFQYVSRLSVDPFNSLTILAATRSGIWRSVNGGTNWTPRLGTEVLCIAFNPTNDTQAVASGYNGNTFYSTDGGQTWLVATGIPVVSGFVVDRVELAYSRTNPAIVFASVDNSSGQVYRSLDGGHTYTVRYAGGNNYLGSQGWYDNFVWVDPVNTNVVIVGGLDVWRSTDGGLTFTDIGGYSGSIHPDQHVLVASPFYNGTTTRTIFVGNDGGVFRAADAYTASSASGWTTLNHNLGITQFYGGAGNASTSVIIGGTQDNGTLRYTTSGGPQGWTSMFGGDGGQCASDPSNSSYFYGEYVDLQIHRSSNGGLTSSYIYSGIADAGNNANFIAPFILDPNNPNTMLAGGVSLWRSTNVKAATPTWAAIKPSIGTPISAIVVAPGNSDVIYVGHNNGAVYYTANGTAASPTWTLRNSGLPARYNTSLTVSTNGRVYATFGGYSSGNVWQSSNNGLSWVNISGNLPLAPMNSLVVAPFDPNTFYVGSDVGVYGTSTGGAAWSTGNDGPANVAVDQLFWLGPKLIAVTHGRGMFSIVPLVGPPSLVSGGFTLNDGNTNGLVDPNECSQVYLFIRNTNGPTATNITATLTTTTPGLVIMQGSSAYPNIPAGTTVTNLTPFQFTTSAGFVCGSTVNLNLNVAVNGTNLVVPYILPSSGSYLLVQTNGVAIVPGTTDTGNHGQNVLTAITLPFPVTYYGRTFTNATLCSNGNLQFIGGNFAAGGVCLPVGGLNYPIFPFWDNLRTDLGSDGVYTSVTGTAPNRTFNIEWRAALVSSSAEVDFEIVLYESQLRVDFIYGALGDPGATATVGIQRDIGSAYSNFECSAGGLTPGLQLSYQWQCTDGGGQCAPIPNFSASPTSGPVPLTVNFTNRTLPASTYSWDFGDGNTSVAVNPANTYVSAGAYTVTLTASNSGGIVALTQTNYILVTNVPPSITIPPVPQTVAVGVPAIFTVGAAGTPPLAYQWRFNGVPIGGATDTTYTVPAPQCADGGPYDVVVTNVSGSITSSVALLTAETAPSIVMQPTNVTVAVNTRLSLAVGATNDCGDGLTYQWVHSGTNVGGATFSTYSRLRTQLTDAGTYQVVVTNFAGSATSLTAVVTVLAPPSIATPPASQSVAVGSNATFTVSSTGTPPLYYQWRFNGTPINGATDTTYTRTNAQCTDAGGFDVVVSNSISTVTSPLATLTVVAPAVILVQPTNTAVLVGQTATLQTTATNDCGGGLSYQWLLSTNSLANATNSSLVISNAQVSDTGDYLVIVADLAGSVTSSVAHLSVVGTVAPTILGPAISGTNFTFSFQSVAGKTYVVQYEDDLQSASWLTLQTIPGDGTLKTVVTPIAASPRRFYRLSVQ